MTRMKRGGGTLSVSRLSVTSAVSRRRRHDFGAVLDALLRPGDCFVDVGAGNGGYTMWAAGRVGHAGRVYAFEPDERLRVSLQMALRQRGLGGVRVLPDVVSASGHEEGATTLDDQAYRIPDPVLVRLGAYCAAPDILRGAVGLIERARPALLCRIDPDGRPDLLESLMISMAQSGYRIHNFRGARLAASGPFTPTVLALSPRSEHFSEIRTALRADAGCGFRPWLRWTGW